ncbi:hypothetical protein B0H11DRAFT_1918003 [Mycena galericulata]|nr:hypothetical protein B0H11DRAFT_1918003 [Mycena galericulata]
MRTLSHLRAGVRGAWNASRDSRVKSCDEGKVGLDEITARCRGPGVCGKRVLILETGRRMVNGRGRGQGRDSRKPATDNRSARIHAVGGGGIEREETYLHRFTSTLWLSKGPGFSYKSGVGDLHPFRYPSIQRSCPMRVQGGELENSEVVVLDESVTSLSSAPLLGVVWIMMQFNPVNGTTVHGTFRFICQHTSPPLDGSSRRIPASGPSVLSPTSESLSSESVFVSYPLYLYTTIQSSRRSDRFKITVAIRLFVSTGNRFQVPGFRDQASLLVPKTRPSSGSNDVPRPICPSKKTSKMRTQQSSCKFYLHSPPKIPPPQPQRNSDAIHLTIRHDLPMDTSIRTQDHLSSGEKIAINGIPMDT